MAKDKKVVETNKDVMTPFGNINYILFAVGLVIITAGWFLLRAGRISISPIMLILGYCVVIPVAIILKPKDKKEDK